MNVRKKLYAVSLNRLSRMEFRYFEQEQKISKLPSSAKKSIKNKYENFRLLKAYYNWILFIEALCFILIYISFISLVADNIPILSSLTEQAAGLTAAVGIPVLTLIVFFMEKTKNVLVVDGMWIMTEIISTMTTYGKKTK